MDGWTDGQTDRQIEINEPLINGSLRKSQFKSISSRLAVKSLFNSNFDFESTAPGKTGPTRLEVLKSTQVNLSGSTPRSSLSLHGRHAFTTGGVRLKQKISFSNFCPGRGLNPGTRSLMAVNVTTRLLAPPARLRRHPKRREGVSNVDRISVNNNTNNYDNFYDSVTRS